MTEYAALAKTPHSLADGLMLVFQHPVNAVRAATVTNGNTENHLPSQLESAPTLRRWSMTVNADHSVAVVHLFHDEVGINGAGEAGPARAGVEFVGQMVAFTCH
jgi:hypothetical protein